MDVLEQAGDVRYEFPDLNGEEKLKELIIFISNRSIEDETFGAIKLNKIIYRSDFWHYAKYGVPITGVSYQSIEMGPSPRRTRPILTEMEAGNEIVIHKRPYYTRTQHRVIPSREANLNIFSASEIAMVNDVIKHFWEVNAEDVTRETHGKAWEVAGEGGLIPYEAAYLSDDEITRADIARAKELDSELGWGEF